VSLFTFYEMPNFVQERSVVACLRWTVEDGADRWLRNVGNELPTKKNEDLKYKYSQSSI
jgi:hypothetical protein